MAKDAEANQSQYYLNLETGEVEQGKVSDWTRRMGPYASREEAAQAFEKAADRNANFDEQEAKWQAQWKDDEDDDDDW